MISGRRALRLGAALALWTAISTRAEAQAQTGADLNISPKRVVFAPADRTATVYVFNRGGEAATYNISLVDRVMTPDGQVRDVNDRDVKATAGEFVAKLASAQPMLVYTPRRVTLKPGESQAIRIRALRPPELTGPEYHTHLTVSTVPPESAGLTAEEAAKAAPGQLSVKISTLFSIAIAVIVRQGAVDVQGGIDHVSYQVKPAGEAGAGRTAVLTLDLLRKGADSLYADVEVRDAKASKASPPLGAVRGVGVYTEVDRRSIQVPLAKVPASGQQLEITLRDDDSKPGQVLATALFTAP
jgi:P pilus assembly chaperone PapD